MECSGVFSATQFAYRKSLGTCGAFLWVPHTLHSSLESWQVARIVQIDFNAATDWVKTTIRIFSISSALWGSVFWILTPFLPNGSQHVMVNSKCCRSKLVKVVSGVPPGRIIGPLLFLLYTSELFPILENKQNGYADDSTLIDGWYD